MRTQAQKRILALLSDGLPHALIPELLQAGHWNQHPAIDALAKKNLIKETIVAGYYSRWTIVASNPGDK